MSARPLAWFPMAVEPETLRVRTRPSTIRSVVRFDADAGTVTRRAELYEDGELASASLTVCSRVD